MGGAIARGLAQGHCVNVQDIIVTNPSTPKLEKLKTEFPEICVSTNNEDADDADIVISQQLVNLSDSQLEILDVAAVDTVDLLDYICRSLRLAEPGLAVPLRHTVL